MKKDWLLVIGGVAIVIVIFAIIGYSKVSKNVQGASTSTSSSPSAEATSLSQNQKYFSSSAKVMYFYSDYCHWCQKEEAEVLPGLGDQGYTVKPMDVAPAPQGDPTLWQTYKIDGTPTFIAANGDRLTGYQDAPTLKAWLNAHK